MAEGQGLVIQSRKVWGLKWGFRGGWFSGSNGFGAQMLPQHFCLALCSPPSSLLTWRRPGQVNSCSCELRERTEPSGGSLALPSPLLTPSPPVQPYLALPGGWVRDARPRSRVLRALWLSLGICSVSWGREGDTSSCHQPWLGGRGARGLPRAHLETRVQPLQRGVPVGVAGRWHRGPEGQGRAAAFGICPRSPKPLCTACCDPSLQLREPPRQQLGPQLGPVGRVTAASAAWPR